MQLGPRHSTPSVHTVTRTHACVGVRMLVRARRGCVCLCERVLLRQGMRTATATAGTLGIRNTDKIVTACVVMATRKTDKKMSRKRPNHIRHARWPNHFNALLFLVRAREQRRRRRRRRRQRRRRGRRRRVASVAVVVAVLAPPATSSFSQLSPKATPISASPTARPYPRNRHAVSDAEM